MGTIRWTQAGFLVAVLAAGARADEPISADRPGLANGSSVVGGRTLQVELGTYGERAPGDAAGFATPLLLRYGLGDAFELRVETDGYQRASAAGAATVDGWAPVSLGFKYRFADESGGRPAVGVIGRVFPRSGSGAFRSARTTGDLVLTADKSLGERWAVNPNVGIAWGDEDGRYTALLAALTVQYSVTPTVGVFVDTAWQRPEVPDGGSAGLVDAGGAWIVRHDTQLDLSFGWGAHGETVPDWFWSAGLSRRF
jgi:outer membrane putative beta-barrel porin/alpha-amylase